ncbi:MAG: Holliday junction resolvase RuvX, partial [Pseudomonadota bacterium]
MPDPIQTVIGFDFGSHSIGIAVGQTLTGTATPITAVKTNDWKSIGNILSDWQPQLLIIGLPLNMQGEEQL